MRLRPCLDADRASIFAIINDAAQAYRGVIPDDCWHEPYMAREALAAEIAAGVRFFGCERDGALHGVMGIQDVKDVTLVRHAYVATGAQRTGIGARLLSHLRTLTDRPMLIGTWAAASWAIDFYRRHGFELVLGQEKDRLLHTYWTVPARQVATSIVLVDERWRRRGSTSARPVD